MGTIQKIKEFLKGDVTDSKDMLEKYSRDASLFHIQPELVVFPKDNDDVKKNPNNNNIKTWLSFSLKTFFLRKNIKTIKKRENRITLAIACVVNIPELTNGKKYILGKRTKTMARRNKYKLNLYTIYLKS